MKAIKYLLILGMCVGLSLEAAKVTTPPGIPPSDDSIYWSPDKGQYSARVKRDSNGDRI